MVKTRSPSQSVAAERRSGIDRRRRDKEPPSGWERRRAVEPRKPEIVELEVSASQWDALQDEAYTGTAATPPGRI